MHEIVAPESLPPATSELVPEARRCRLRFTGTGEEYFGIWIVNLLLTIVTLGIYSAWAKVRKMQYFYRNTQLDGTAFEYHGNPVAILKGRVLAVALLVAYKVSVTMLGAFALVAVLAVIAGLPWLLTQSYRFRLRNSSYRGLRFKFEGPVWQAYLIFGVPMFLVLASGALMQGAGGDPHHRDQKIFIVTAVCYVTLALAWPYLHFSFKRWQHSYARYGAAKGIFVARAGDFYGAYIAAVGFIIFGLISMSLLAGVVGAGQSAGKHASSGILLGLAFVVVGLVSYAGVLWASSIVTAWVQNAVWSGTRFESVGFSSEVGVTRLTGITLGNIVMVVFSLGLLIPFAVMRLMKYKIESIEVLDADALSRFVGEGRGEEVGATGEGAVDVMDLDFGL